MIVGELENGIAIRVGQPGVCVTEQDFAVSQTTEGKNEDYSIRQYSLLDYTVHFTEKLLYYSFHYFRDLLSRFHSNLQGFFEPCPFLFSVTAS